jgi:casein kinase 1, delta
VAVKVAMSGNMQSNKSLNDENYVHRTLIKNGMTLLPKFIKDGYFGDCPYIMSEYAEYSIEEYIKIEDFPGKLSLQLVYKQMIDAVEQMHTAGFFHKDIKPDNFRIKDNRVVLIDFGIALNLYRDNSHIKRDRFGFEGTPFFGSIRALQGYTLSRRDDIESVGYSLLYLLNPLVKDVPWV